MSAASRKLEDTPSMASERTLSSTFRTPAGTTTSAAGTTPPVDSTLPAGTTSLSVAVTTCSGGTSCRGVTPGSEVTASRSDATADTTADGLGR